MISEIIPELIIKQEQQQAFQIETHQAHARKKQPNTRHHNHHQAPLSKRFKHNFSDSYETESGEVMREREGKLGT